MTRFLKSKNIRVITRGDRRMSMVLVKYAKRSPNVFVFVAKYMRVLKSHHSCVGMRELARIYYRAHPEL